jgi:hypothetical protein
MHPGGAARMRFPIEPSLARADFSRQYRPRCAAAPALHVKHRLPPAPWICSAALEG